MHSLKNTYVHIPAMTSNWNDREGETLRNQYVKMCLYPWSNTVQRQELCCKGMCSDWRFNWSWIIISAADTDESYGTELFKIANEDNVPQLWMNVQCSHTPMVAWLVTLSHYQYMIALEMIRRWWVHVHVHVCLLDVFTCGVSNYQTINRLLG